jgi:serine/threonine-protein kinase RsbT
MVDEQPLLTQPLQTDEDVVRLRKLVRDHLVRLGFSLVEQTKMVTAASELARNTLRYGGGGEAHVDELQNGGKRPGLVLPTRGRALPTSTWRSPMAIPRAADWAGLVRRQAAGRRIRYRYRAGRGNPVSIIKWKLLTASRTEQCVAVSETVDVAAPPRGG